MNDNQRFHAAGKFTSRGEWTHPEAITETSEIIIVTDGCVKIEEAGMRYALSPGEVLFLDGGEPHFGYEATSERTSFYWIHFQEDNPSKTRSVQKHFALRDPYNVSILCRQLLHYDSMGAGAEVVNSVMSVLLYELSLQSRPDDDSENALSRRIKEWIRINSDRMITAKDVAEKFGYNTDYISRLMKRYYGSGLKAQINMHKMQFIKWCLLERDYTLAQTADAVGFSDYKLFLNYFKYHEGMTPGDFKRTYYAIHTNNK